MLIQVQYTDKNFDYVNQIMLDDLLEVGRVSGFRRSSGWVTVGVDPIRQVRRSKSLFRSPAAMYSKGVH